MSLIAEFEAQSFTQIIFPHINTDWSTYLQEAEATFIDIISAIQKYQNCFIICADITYVKSLFTDHEGLYFAEYESNDTWARDCSALSVHHQGGIELLDFSFNAWGNKFAYEKDNALSAAMQNIYLRDLHTLDFVLEGGAVDTNGEGLLLSTDTCIYNPNRNPHLSEIDIQKALRTHLGAQEILSLKHGALLGDDTDSHIDTLARFIDSKTIMYVQCKDTQDVHYENLQKMQEELEVFARKYTLTLIPLPLPSAIYYEKQRLPATYANFLFVNGAVLVPMYSVAEDTEALEIFSTSFPSRDIIPIECSTLIKQHGSLHCVTMNFAKGVTLLL